MSKPKKYGRRVLIQIDQQTLDELDARRQFQGVSLAETVRRALRAYLFGSIVAVGPANEIVLDAGTWSPDEAGVKNVKVGCTVLAREAG